MASRPRTRLAPDARRVEILDHARRLFGASGYEAVSASDVARAAGVTPALVVHYFPGGKRELFLELVAQLTDTIMGTIRVPRTGPVSKRVQAAVESWLDWLDANRETWLATAAQGEYLTDPDLRALVHSGWERTIDTLINDFADVLADDAPTRLMLRNWLGFNRASGRSWLRAQATREQTALQLTETLHHLITRVAPALQTLPANDSAIAEPSR